MSAHAAASPLPIGNFRFVRGALATHQLRRSREARRHSLERARQQRSKYHRRHLWASDLFASVSQNGFAFETPVAAALREDLAGLADEALRWSALDAVDRTHRERDPFTRLEERIHRLDVEGGTGATAAQ